MDVHEPEIRSYNMSRIRSKDTKPEMMVRKFLHAQGFRYNLHGKYKGIILPGKPDIVLPKYKTVIFVHGCFWHGHEGCKYFKIPETRTDWWKAKIERNIETDRNSKQKLSDAGWKILTIWQCELHKDKILVNYSKLLQSLSYLSPAFVLKPRQRSGTADGLSLFP